MNNGIKYIYAKAVNYIRNGDMVKWTGNDKVTEVDFEKILKPALDALEQADLEIPRKHNELMSLMKQKKKPIRIPMIYTVNEKGLEKMSARWKKAGERAKYDKSLLFRESMH